MKIIALFSIVITSAFLWACGQTNNGTPTNTNTAAAPSPQASLPPADEMARGRELYKSNCSACHKEDGKGGKITIEGKSINPDDLTSAKIKGFTDEKIYGYIYNGIEEEGMPAFKDDLSEAEIREVVRYLRADIQKTAGPAAKD